MQDKTKKIKEYWESQAIEHGSSPLASTRDTLARGLEIQNIAKYLSPGKKILDIGCSNGYSTFELAKNINSIFIGADYSDAMIKQANKELECQPLEVKQRLKFQVADVLGMPFDDEEFDIVFSDRCLINLPNHQSQIQAANEISRVLRKGGAYIMCENTKQGLAKLNQFREKADLSKITNHWHNLYIDETKFFDDVNNIFKLTKIDNFASTYYLASRIFNAKLAEIENKDPDYNHPINQIAAKLPACGDCSALKISILIKK